MKLVLHNYWRSSASHRVRIALELKQLAFEYAIVNILQRDQFTEGYRGLNPMSQVPTLVATEPNGTMHTLTQSLPILEFLDERFPTSPLLPKDPYRRHHVRALCEIINSGIQPLQNLTVTKAIKALGHDTNAWCQSYITPGLAAFEQEVKASASQFCAGDAITFADCFLVPQLASARRVAVEVERFPLLLEIEARCLALPAFERAAPDQQPDAVK
ncbi:maleylacetoacetate isomerase [soil metagenome]